MSIDDLVWFSPGSGPMRQGKVFRIWGGTTGRKYVSIRSNDETFVRYMSDVTLVTE